MCGYELQPSDSACHVLSRELLSHPQVGCNVLHLPLGMDT